MTFRLIKESFNCLLKSNSNLDDAIYIYKSMNDLKHYNNRWFKKTVLRNYIHAFLIILKRIITVFDKRRKLSILPKNTEVLLYVNSNNTFNSLKFLKDMNETVFFEQSNRINLYSSSRASYIHNIKTPLWLILFSLICFPYFSLKYWGKIVKYPNLYFENFGKDYINSRLLKKYKNLKKVVFANDHNVENRLFKTACKKQNIKTIYLQHASITSYFPKLDFDQSFLFGSCDLKKYLSIGEVEGEVILVGSPKFDELYSLRRNSDFKEKHILGIAINIADESNNIKLLVDKILSRTSFSIIIRFHPGDKREFQFNSNRVKSHNAKKIALVDFFSEIDFLIAGDSSIHLESLYINIPSIYAKLTDFDTQDYYHYIRENLINVIDFNNISDKYFEDLLIPKINSKILKKFIHSIDETYEGHISSYVINQIAEDYE